MTNIQVGTLGGGVSSQTVITQAVPAAISGQPEKSYVHVDTGQNKRRQLTVEDEASIADVLDLNENQAKAIAEFSSTIVRETIETLVSEFDVQRLKKVGVKRLAKPTGGVCDVAIANGNRDHVLSNLWTIELDLADGTTQTMNLGSDCFARAAGLTPQEVSLCRALNTWVCDSANRSLLKMLAKGIQEGVSAVQMNQDFKKSKGYQDLQSDIQIVAKNSELAYHRNAKPVARKRAIGRTLVAVKSATLLLVNDLPVPSEIIGKIARAAVWVEAHLKRRQNYTLPTPAQVVAPSPQPIMVSAPVSSPQPVAMAVPAAAIVTNVAPASSPAPAEETPTLSTLSTFVPPSAAVQTVTTVITPAPAVVITDSTFQPLPGNGRLF